MAWKASEEARKLWKERILQQRESGFSETSWCHQNNVAVHSFRYWRHKFFPKPLLDRSAFKEISDRHAALNVKAGISLEYRGVCIHIDAQFDIIALKQCLKALREMPC